MQNYIAHSTCNSQEKYTKENTIYPLCTEVYMYKIYTVLIVKSSFYPIFI